MRMQPKRSKSPQTSPIQSSGHFYKIRACGKERLRIPTSLRNKRESTHYVRSLSLGGEKLARGIILGYIRLRSGDFG